MKEISFDTQSSILDFRNLQYTHWPLSDCTASRAASEVTNDLGIGNFSLHYQCNYAFLVSRTFPQPK